MRSRLLHVDESPEGQIAYYIASPDNATQRYLYAVALGGADLKRVTPDDMPGWHDYRISPNGKWAIHTLLAYRSASHDGTREPAGTRDHSRTGRQQAPRGKAGQARYGVSRVLSGRDRRGASSSTATASSRPNSTRRRSTRCWSTSTANRPAKPSPIVGAVPATFGTRCSPSRVISS